jgi:hypothetical protein
VKRILICASLILALVLTGVAVANIRSFSGKFEGGGTDSFKAKFRHGAPVKVKGSTNPNAPGWAWNNVPIRCNKPAPHNSTTTGHFTFPMPVNNKGKFHASGSNGVSTATVRGEFSNNGRRAFGRFRVRGVIGADSQCDTQVRRWHAKH